MWGIVMKKIRDEMIETLSDTDSLTWVKPFIERYPTEKGYRVEFFLSPRLIRIQVWKVSE